MNSKYTRLKAACYTSNISMSILNLPPLLFMTFRSLYEVSYSLLGFLVLVTYCTQLIIDLVFSFFSHKFNIAKTVKIMPVITVVGFIVYTVLPLLFPQHAYIGLLIGTLIYSAAAGLAEVLISPIIAAIPSENPDKEMSKLHAIYAWGVAPVIVIGTLFIFLFGGENWHWLMVIASIVPLTSAILFAGAKIPEMKTPERVSGALHMLKDKKLLLCVLAIFLGGASESTMAQWASGYLEQSLKLPKVLGDVIGAAGFGIMLATGRTLYAKYGKNIEKVLIAGAAGAFFCYLISAVTPIPLIGLVTCALTGFCTSMLWPGNLIVAAKKVPDGGVFMYALMAAGGDLGGSVGPQLVGIIADYAIKIPAVSELSVMLNLSPDRLGMKLGMLFGMLFPLAAIPLLLHLKKEK